MISLQKHPEPGWLSANRAARTLEYLQAPTGGKPAPWRAAEVLDALRSESHAKCMYCEGFIEDVSYLTVDHIAPKSKFPEKVMEWGNLGLACPNCNSCKSNYWSDSPDIRILNPYEDIIEDHLIFFGPLVTAVLGSGRGENTVRRLKLTKRTELVFSKIAKIEEMNHRLERWQRETDVEKKALLAEDVNDAISHAREFSATLRAYVIAQGFEPDLLSR